jgi:mitochondrial import inner membrane translocase subunit TIM16
MNEFKEKMGSMITTPMTREEALQILNIPKESEQPNIEPDKVMERFETLIEKNQSERGGSFYIQSKIYFAKEFLMQDFPTELNKSKFNPGEAPQQSESEKAE